MALPRENAWEHREPSAPGGETDLDPVANHYKSMLDLPF
jgi:hypothetical protein